MKKLLPLIIAAAFAGASLSAVAQDKGKDAPKAPAASSEKTEKGTTAKKGTTKGEKKSTDEKKGTDAKK